MEVLVREGSRAAERGHHVADADETRARYLVEREERRHVDVAPDVEAGEADEETAEGTPGGIDPELIRKLEEFKRQMFDPSHREGGEGTGGTSE